MLKYLIAVTENTVILAIMLGYLYAFIGGNYGRRGVKILSAGALAGLALSIAYAVLRGTTKLIDRSGGNPMWNVRTYAVSLGALAALLILCVPPLRKRLGKAGEILVPCVVAILALSYVFYAMPTVIAYPANFNVGKESIFSTAFIYRFIGYLFGLILALVTAAAVYQCARRIGSGLATVLMLATLAVNAFQQVVKGLSILISKRMIINHDLFVFTSYWKNQSNLFIYAILLLAAVMPVILWARSFRVREPYSNPAQRRRIKARWRATRRWATAVCACFLLVVLNLTAFAAIESREVELSPPEECEVRDGNVCVSLAQVDDGHLHRFEYATENKVNVRFIVIKKPNSSSYGVGLDACDICGETGYFERGGQIVCKLCDVVMNVNTIGFKGGCNPIVIEYSIKDGFITVPVEALVAHEKEFK